MSRLVTQRKTVPDRKSMPVVKAFKKSLSLQHVATVYLNEHNQNKHRQFQFPDWDTGPYFITLTVHPYS